MQSKYFILFFLFFSFSFFQSCTYNKADVLNPNIAACDNTTPVSYLGKVVPILSNNCYRCHGVSFPSGNVAMGTYETDKVIGLNGRLYGSITHAPGFVPMPRSSNKLTDCEISTIKKWIDSGCPNN